MSANSIEVELRKETGKNQARRLRVAGKIPAVVYGGGKETVAITVDRKVFQDYFRGGATDNSIFLLQMKGTDQKRHCMIRQIDIDPVSLAMSHVDFIRVEMSQKIKVRVPVVLENTAICIGVKTDGGMLDFVTREIEIECLPNEIPASIPVDVKDMTAGKFLRISDLAIDETKHRIIGDREKVVVHVSHAQKEEVVAAEEAVVPAEGSAEPEVIKKGKKEEAGAEAKPAGKK
jgi:large subunit ribosomal protein L25